MTVSTINIDKDTQEFLIYFKEYDYCVRTKISYQTWMMYCEINSLPEKEIFDMQVIDLKRFSERDKQAIEDLLAL